MAARSPPEPPPASSQFLPLDHALARAHGAKPPRATSGPRLGASSGFVPTFVSPTSLPSSRAALRAWPRRACRHRRSRRRSNGSASPRRDHLRPTRSGAGSDLPACQCCVTFHSRFHSPASWSFASVLSKRNPICRRFLNGRTWDRSRREAYPLDATSGDFSSLLQGLLVDAEGRPISLSTTGFHSALGQIRDKLAGSGGAARVGARARCGSWRADESSGGGRLRAPLPARAGAPGDGSTAAAAAVPSRRRSRGARRGRVRSSRRSGRGIRGGDCS